MISFRGVRVSVPAPAASGRGWVEKHLLDGIDLELGERRVALVGANGSGKSTMLRLVNGLVRCSQGTVEVDGLNPGTDAARVRRRVGFVFTDPLSQLVMPTPVEDVELSLRRTVPDRRARRARAASVLAERGLERVAEQSIYDLSGGERQLVALTAVLAVEPSVLVMDEPTTLLDLRNRNRFVALLDDLPQQVLLATHDLALAERADRVVVVEAGRVAADGAPRETLDFYARSQS